MPGIRKPVAEISVVGKNGRMNVSNDSLEIILKSACGSYHEGRTLIDNASLQRPVPFDLAGPFYTEQFVEFVRAVKNGKNNRNDLSESVDNHRILDAIKNSNGRLIVIPSKVEACLPDRQGSKL